MNYINKEEIIQQQELLWYSLSTRGHSAIPLLAQ